MYEIRVLVVEDDPLIAEDIREFLTNVDYNVVGVEHHKEGALKSLKNNLPDVVLSFTGYCFTRYQPRQCDGWI